MMGFFFVLWDKETTGQKSLHCSGTKGQQDKLKILPRNGPGWDFDILPQDGLRRDFDSQLPFELLFEKLLWLHLEPEAHLPNQNANQLEFEPSRM